MFKLNLITALRNLWKHKGFSLINIGGLAIGLASCLMLLLYVIMNGVMINNSRI